MTDCGYVNGTMKGENLFSGSSDTPTVLAGWKNSPAPNQLLLTPGFRMAGIARALGGSRAYWVLDVGDYDDSGATVVTTTAGSAPITLAATPTQTPTADYAAVQSRFEPVFICMRGPGALVRPLVGT